MEQGGVEQCGVEQGGVEQGGVERVKQGRMGWSRVHGCEKESFFTRTIKKELKKR